MRKQSQGSGGPRKKLHRDRAPTTPRGSPRSYKQRVLSHAKKPAEAREELPERSREKVSVLVQSRVGPPQLARCTSLDNKIQPNRWTKDENRYVTQEDTRMAKEPRRRCLSELVLTEMQTKNHNKTGRPDNTKCWRGRGATGTPAPAHYWWE